MFDLEMHCQKQANAMVCGRSLITDLRYTHAPHASFEALREGFKGPRNLAAVFVLHVLLILHPAAFICGEI